MSQPATDALWLRDKRVSFTGRLASMSRAEAIDWIARHGGAVDGAVSKATDFLIVGQDGGPLDKAGRLTAKLQKARVLQRAGWPLVILPEEELLARLGLAEDSSIVHRLYTVAQLGRILHVPTDRIRGWLRAGLLRPAETRHGLAYFDYRQVSWVRTLADLTRAGVKTELVRKSLARLRRWLPDAEHALVLLEQNGQLLVRLENGQLAEPTGQPHFDFNTEDAPQPIVVEKGDWLRPTAATMNGGRNGRCLSPFSKPRSAADWFERGCALEQERPAEAAEAYRQALLAGGPDAVTCFNLANTLYALGQRAQAAERYRQAVEIDPLRVDAWNNLGIVLGELGQSDEAVRALRRALEVSPFYADAHYNLADTLEQASRPAEARHHWQAYVKHDPSGPWADYARLRLRGAV